MSLRSTLFSVGLTCVATFAMAQSPSAPLTIVVPYPAGGPLDTSARIVAEGAAAQLGSITVENKPGAGGSTGADQVAKATDLHTFGVMNNSQLTIARLLSCMTRPVIWLMVTWSPTFMARSKRM